MHQICNSRNLKEIEKTKSDFNHGTSGSEPPTHTSQIYKP